MVMLHCRVTEANTGAYKLLQFIQRVTLRYRGLSQWRKSTSDIINHYDAFNSSVIN